MQAQELCLRGSLEESIKRQPFMTNLATHSIVCFPRRRGPHTFVRGELLKLSPEIHPNALSKAAPGFDSDERCCTRHLSRWCAYGGVTSPGLPPLTACFLTATSTRCSEDSRQL